MNLKRTFPWLLIWIGLLMFVTALSPWLVTLLWCWGYFGRDNLVFQYWWQCDCPRESESVRYAPYRVLVSACSRAYLSDVLQDNKTMLIINDLPAQKLSNLSLIDVEQETMHILDLGGRVSHNLYLITDSIALMRYGSGRGIYAFVNLATGETTDVRSEEYIASEVSASRSNPEILDILKTSESVFIPERRQIIIGTTIDFDANKSVIIRSTTVNSFDSAKQFLMDNNIQFHTVINFMPRLQSPDGRYEARKDGVYDLITNERIVSARQPQSGQYQLDSFKPQFWSSDGRKVIYGRGGYIGIVNTDVFGSHWPVPQPILILDVPPQYWPASTPAP